MKNPAAPPPQPRILYEITNWFLPGLVADTVSPIAAVSSLYPTWTQVPARFFIPMTDKSKRVKIAVVDRNPVTQSLTIAGIFDTDYQAGTVSITIAPDPLSWAAPTGCALVIGKSPTVPSVTVLCPPGAGKPMREILLPKQPLGAVFLSQDATSARFAICDDTDVRILQLTSSDFKITSTMQVFDPLKTNLRIVTPSALGAVIFSNGDVSMYVVAGCADGAGAGGFFAQSVDKAYPSEFLNRGGPPIGAPASMWARNHDNVNSDQFVQVYETRNGPTLLRELSWRSPVCKPGASPFHPCQIA